MYFSDTGINLYFCVQSRTHNFSSWCVIFYWPNKNYFACDYYKCTIQDTLYLINHDPNEMHLSTCISPTFTESPGCTQNCFSCCKAWDLSGVISLVGAVTEHNHHMRGSRTDYIQSHYECLCLMDFFFIVSENISEKDMYWQRLKTSKLGKRLPEHRMVLTWNTVLLPGRIERLKKVVVIENFGS